MPDIIKCKKCGSGDLFTEYHGDNDHGYDRRRISGEIPEGEHLLRGCRCCGFRWCVPCADAKEVPDAK